MPTTASIKTHGLRPSPHATIKDYLSRGMISVRLKSTFANMPPLRERLFNNTSTSRTCLRREPRVNLDELDTSTFRLVFEYSDKLAPASVRNRPGELVVLDHSLNVQAFHNDPAIAVNKLCRELVMLIAASVGDLCVQRSNLSFLLLTVRTPELLTGQASLGNAQRFENILQRLQRLLCVAVVVGDERLQSNIENLR